MTYAMERTGALSSRGLVFGFILLGHLGFFWMMNSGLVSGTLIPERFTRYVDVDEPAPKESVEPPPPPQPVEFKKVVVELPPIDVGPEVQDREGAITTEVTQTPVIQLVPEVLKKIVLPMANPRRLPSQPPYPSASQRLNEEGKVILELYVLEDGRVGEATVYKSSGYPRLDQAAVEEAKRAWRLLPGTEDGRPKAMRYQFAVTFRLNQ